MQQRYQYIKGKIKAKYTGDPTRVKAKTDKTFDQAFSLNLRNVVITDATEISGYDIESINKNSFELPYLSIVSDQIGLKNNPEAKQYDFINVIIENVELSNIVQHEGQSFGTLSGNFYGTIDTFLGKKTAANQLNTPPPVTPKTARQSLFARDSMLGCLRGFLAFLGLILLLILLWCFLFGDCSFGRMFQPCPICPEPIVQRDTIIVIKNDTIRIRPDSTETVIENDTTYQLGTGQLQVSLFWQDKNDLDLVVQTPSGDYLYFRNKQLGGGKMDFDKNASSGDLSTTPVENIFWNTPPPGRYTVYVMYWRRNQLDLNSTDFKVRIKLKDRIQTFEGSLNRALHDQRRELNLRNLEFEDYALKVHEFEIN